MEKVNLLTPDDAARLIKAAMLKVRRTRKGRRVEEWGVNNPVSVNVQLLVNGVEVPVIDTLRELLDQEYAELDAQARGLALSMLDVSGLRQASDAISSANIGLARLFAQISNAIPDEEN